MAPTVWGLTETNITYQTKTAADKTYNNPTSSFLINLPSSQWLSGTRTMCKGWQTKEHKYLELVEG